MFARIKEEIISAIPAIIFFIISFNLIQYTESLMLRPYEHQYFNYFTITIGALVLGKFLIIVNSFSFINLFPHKPLVYNITWKIMLYGSLSILYRIAERFVETFITQDNAAAAYHLICMRLSSPVFWAIQLWLVMILAVYSVSSEFTRVIGKKRISEMLWG